HPQRRVRLSAWEYGSGTAESAARTAQMITSPTNSESVRKKQGGHSLPTAQPHQAEVMARELEIICHRAVETAPLAELRRANTNPAAVAQFVDRVEYVDDIETDFESSFLRDLDSARQADV